MKLTPCLAAVLLAGCAAGPSFVKPTPPTPEDWTGGRGGDDTLRIPVSERQILPADWWRSFGDPVLDSLEHRAFGASPDLATAALHVAEARVQRSTVAAQRAPEVDFNGGVNRYRLSEFDPSTRLLDIVGGKFGINRNALAELLAEPFTLYQAGFDASWEPDLWGKVRRSVEAADAGVAQQVALLDLTRLTLASEVARSYFELRTAQQQARLLREDIAALADRASLIEARVQGGIADHLDLERQLAELDALKAQLPGQLAQESASASQLAVLLGELPGALSTDLKEATDRTAKLPDLAFGLPSEVALRRPDIRAAEARLHQATASIGVARADLYPSVRLGAHFGTESYLSDEVFDWASRTWSFGPTVNLPLFDHGRRKSIVQLRTLEQQEAAVSYRRTVLAAWKEIDDALTSYAAEQQQARELIARVAHAGDAYQLAQARYDGGTIDFLAVLDSQRSYVLARRDLAASEGRLNIRFVTLNKAIGNVPQLPDARSPGQK
jgi:NodT family efflux transporter outer membrane factor (OMF) lipoprotein